MRIEVTQHVRVDVLPFNLRPDEPPRLLLVTRVKWLRLAPRFRIPLRWTTVCLSSCDQLDLVEQLFTDKMRIKT